MLRPAREWTCPEHDWPGDHVCDCPDCDREWDCDLCAQAEWRPLLNDDGTPVMRKVPDWKALLLEAARFVPRDSTLLLDAFARDAQVPDDPAD